MSDMPDRCTRCDKPEWRADLKETGKGWLCRECRESTTDKVNYQVPSPKPRARRKFKHRKPKGLNIDLVVCRLCKTIYEKGVGSCSCPKAPTRALAEPYRTRFRQVEVKREFRAAALLRGLVRPSMVDERAVIVANVGQEPFALPTAWFPGRKHHKESK